ncbi:MAG: hypothetical protein QOH39_3281 [Verrucomicrobiota bacterium]
MSISPGASAVPARSLYSIRRCRVRLQNKSRMARGKLPSEICFFLFYFGLAFRLIASIGGTTGPLSTGDACWEAFPNPISPPGLTSQRERPNCENKLAPGYSSGNSMRSSGSRATNLLRLMIRAHVFQRRSGSSLPGGRIFSAFSNQLIASQKRS